MGYLQMDSKNKLRIIWQWILDHQFPVLGTILIIIIAVSGIILILLPKQPQQITNKTNQTPSSKSLPSNKQNVSSSPTPDITTSWNTFTNNNGISVKYPKDGKVLPDLKVAASASSLQIVPDANKQPSQQSTLGTEVLSGKDTLITGKTLLAVVDLVRSKNSTVKILTKPIGILFGGNKGYEWYFTGSTFNGIASSFISKEGKHRVIQFEKDNKHFIILSTFDDQGERLLSTFKLTKI